MTLLRSLYAKVDHLVHELLKFGTVGAFAFVVDVGLFNLLVHAGDAAVLSEKPVTGKVISTVIATCVAFAGNRQWTFRHRRTPRPVRELAQFAAVNVVGLVIVLACLGFSHYVLDLRSALADNVSANVVGLVLSTLFRFYAYRTWVFTHELVDDPVLGRHTLDELDEAPRT